MGTVRTVAWTPEAARHIRPSAESLVPVFDPARVPQTIPDRLVWDFWPVRLRDGSLVSIAGNTVWMTLTVLDHVAPEARHGAATIHAALSDPAGVWSDAGPVFPEGMSRGSRQWAGCATYDPGTEVVEVFYSAVGSPGRPASYHQEIVVTRGRLRFDGAGLSFTGWSDHTVALAADGEMYRTTGGRQRRPGFADAFRDPFLFRDPRTGREFLLFMATMGSAASEFDGAVGIAEAAGDHASWRLLPPLVTADGVNKELERPHIVVRGDRYYLLFSCHSLNFGPGIVGPEGLYGFVAHDLLGPYRPLNVSGLVLANPLEEPHQAYSWLVLNDGRVCSFADYAGIGVQRLDQEARAAYFRGRVAPAVNLEFDGDRTRLLR